MNLTQLLNRREAVLRQAHLANLAYAHAQLTEFAARIARAGLRGRVTLRHPIPDQEIFWATLTALEGNQSVIEEHFTDLEVMDLADVLAFLRGQTQIELTFPLQDLAANFLAPLERELKRQGVEIDGASRPRLSRTDAPPVQPDREQLEEQN